jgi:hypothetical protein
VAAKAFPVKRYRPLGRGISFRIERLYHSGGAWSQLHLSIPHAKEGDSLAANLAETAALDQLIDLLLNAKSKQEVRRLEPIRGHVNKEVILGCSLTVCSSTGVFCMWLSQLLSSALFSSLGVAALVHVSLFHSLM